MTEEEKRENSRGILIFNNGKKLEVVVEPDTGDIMMEEEIVGRLSPDEKYDYFVGGKVEVEDAFVLVHPDCL